MIDEDDYEDLDPIYTDEPFLTMDAEVKYLKTMLIESPHLSVAVADQIDRMIKSKQREDHERATLRREITDSRRTRDLAADL